MHRHLHVVYLRDLLFVLNETKKLEDVTQLHRTFFYTYATGSTFSRQYRREKGYVDRAMVSKAWGITARSPLRAAAGR